MQAAPSIQKLLDELERLPGVGPKSAQRMAYWILNSDRATALRLAEAIAEVKDTCLLYTSPSPRDVEESRLPS